MSGNSCRCNWSLFWIVLDNCIDAVTVMIIIKTTIMMTVTAVKGRVQESMRLIPLWTVFFFLHSSTPLQRHNLFPVSAAVHFFQTFISTFLLSQGILRRKACFALQSVISVPEFIEMRWNVNTTVTTDEVVDGWANGWLEGKVAEQKQKWKKTNERDRRKNKDKILLIG